MKVYKVYKEVNSADTWRDPDDYSYTQYGTFSTFEKAEAKARENMKYWRDKDKKFIKNSDGNYSVTDFCSYGATIYIEVLEVE